MLIPNLFTIMQLFLSIQYSYSFRRFKHAQLTYYKALDSVSFRSFYELTSYDIYVAGETITIDIPTSVVNVSDIVNWKVVNLRRNKLMFVHKNKPQILIDRKRIEDIEFSGKLSDSIIVFSDDEALHVPTIFNPNLTKPVPEWNYIELLYFDPKNVKVSVKRSLPWLKEDDWKFIKEWKMMDYIHFDDKLYLLIKRSIWNEKTKNVTQEISIIRLCLNKGSELLSSAIEIRYNRPEFQTNQITGAIFICLSYYKPEKILLLITKEASNKSLVHTRYFIDEFVSLFDETGQECASGANNYTLMRYHLRSETRSCQKTTYKNCSSNENTVPSVELNFDQISDYHFIFNDDKMIHLPFEDAYNHSLNQTHFCHQTSGWEQICTEIHKNFNQDNSIQKVEAFFYGYPLLRLHLRYINVRLNESKYCNQVGYGYLFCFNIYYKSNYSSIDDAHLHNYLNHRPPGFFGVTKYSNRIFYKFRDLCHLYKSCIHCLMYGMHTKCIWSDSRCEIKKEQNVIQAVNNCFKVDRISPLKFNSSLPETLTIEFDKPLKLTDSQEYLDIKAGPHNYCTNIKQNHNGSIFNCSLRLSESGKFKISVSLRNDRYADTILLSALSTQKVDIVAPEADYLPIVILLFLALFLIPFLLGFSKRNKKQLKKFKSIYKYDTNKNAKKFSNSRKKRVFSKTISTVTRVQAQILPSHMNTIYKSTLKTRPLSKLNNSWKKMSSVSRTPYLSNYFTFINNK
uniref:Uncharacterized protein n=1 Tax=Tetranychus urticae TaxID=32264 RepID=A0A158P4Y6_TETUR